MGNLKTTKEISPPNKYLNWILVGGDKTLTDLVKREDAHHNRITDWKRQLSNHAAAIFAGDCATKSPVDLKALNANIGQLMLENDFFESVLTKLGMLSEKMSLKIISCQSLSRKGCGKEWQKIIA